MFFGIAAIALLVEAAVGYPVWLFARIGHPVTWMGAVIAWCDRNWNQAALSATRRRVAGVLLVVVLVFIGSGAGLVVHLAAMQLFPTLVGVLVIGVLASSLLAQRSLYDHVAAVACGLETRGLEGGREAVAHIVGRDPSQLDEAGVSRAAIESLSENFSDGVVAPLFWLLVGGLPGAATYKAINTADSMVGHLTEKHRDFGWASARLDDLVNLPASRMTATLIVLVAALTPGLKGRDAIAAVRRDAGAHRSPNAGWPEAAMAGALGLRLAGPRVYEGETVDDTYMGDGRIEAGAEDIRRALRVFLLACVVKISAVFGVAVSLLML
ncbi:MAG: adenosylcobinamide-phosphate synthase CbiB [Pseudomonadota bacterium]